MVEKRQGGRWRVGVGVLGVGVADVSCRKEGWRAGGWAGVRCAGWEVGAAELWSSGGVLRRGGLQKIATPLCLLSGLEPLNQHQK